MNCVSTDYSIDVRFLAAANRTATEDRLSEKEQIPNESFVGMGEKARPTGEITRAAINLANHAKERVAALAKQPY